MNVFVSFPFLRVLFARPVRKNCLFAFFQEVNRNLESYYVVDQRRFISEPFEIQAWHAAREDSAFCFPDEIINYVAGVEDFNVCFRDMKAFEEAYLSSVGSQTRENAEILHHKKEHVRMKFEELRPVVVEAQEVLRRMLEANSAHQSAKG